jgi:hypothetical protein
MTEISYKDRLGETITFSAEIPEIIYVRQDGNNFLPIDASINETAFENDPKDQYNYSTFTTSHDPLIGFCLYKRFLTTEELNQDHYFEIDICYDIDYDAFSKKLIKDYTPPIVPEAV